MGSTVACGGVALVSSTSRGRGTSSTCLGRSGEGAELRQQGFCSALHDFSSSGGALGIHRLQQIVKVGIGIAKVDVAEDPGQRRRRKDASFNLGLGADAGHDLLKRFDQEGKQLDGAICGSGQRLLQTIT